MSGNSCMRWSALSMCSGAHPYLSSPNASSAVPGFHCDSRPRLVSRIRRWQLCSTIHVFDLPLQSMTTAPPTFVPELSWPPHHGRGEISTADMAVVSQEFLEPLRA